MSSYFLGIDVGSTSITSIIIDTKKRKVIESSTVNNLAEVTKLKDKKLGRSEWNMDKIFSGVVETIKTTIDKSKISPEAIGITGQQQGLQLFNKDNEGVGNFISWQDQRCKERFNSKTYIEIMAEMGGATISENQLPFFQNTGCPLVTGYTAPLLFWLKNNNELDEKLTACTAPEFIASKLTDTTPVTDPTDALSWGVFNLNKNDWNYDLIKSLNLKRSSFLEIKNSCSIIGKVTKFISEKTNLKEGTPVSIASGDHQCSFAGTVNNYYDTVAINVGTGGQTSVFHEKIIPRSWLELRPFIQKGYLLAGVGTVGGRSFRVLKNFVQRLIFDMTDINLESDLIYEKLINLANKSLENSSGLNVSALFTGSRENYKAKGKINKITQENFFIENITLALINSMAFELHKAYNESLKCGINKKNILVGSGNGLKKNILLQNALSSKFGLSINIGKNNEEAAIGAALCSGVAVNKYSDIFNASKSFAN